MSTRRAPKSTLFPYTTLFRSLAKQLYKGKHQPGKHETINGLEHIEKVIAIDQSPIGRTPRSNPATYTRDRKSTRLNSSHVANLVCRLLPENKKDSSEATSAVK